MSTSQVTTPQPVVTPLLLTLTRALPGLLALAVAGLVPLWGVYARHWSVLAVVLAFTVQALAAGVLARRRARDARGISARPDDDVLISEFFKTYLTVVLAAVLVTLMAFDGRLLKPGGGVPRGVYDALETWRYWVIVALLVLAEVAVFAWERRGGAGRDLPPETFVAEPLRRLFALQGGGLVLGLIVYWTGSRAGGVAVIVVAEATGVVLLAALARLREARIRAALEAGLSAPAARSAGSKPAGRPAGSKLATARTAKPAPRGGRKRRKR
jgi:hypothetical protein